MSKIITTDSGQQYRTQNFWRNTAGITLGGATYLASKNFLGSQLGKPIYNNISKYGQEVDSTAANKALAEVLKIPKISKMNIGIIDFDKLPKIEFPSLYNYVTGKKAQIVHDILSYPKDILDKEKHINKICDCLVPMWKKPFKTLRENHRDKIRWVFQEGHNALCNTINKNVYVNLKKNCASAFHEIGHLLNPKLGFAASITKFAVPIILGTALLKRKKVEGEKCKNKFDKVTTFVKNNAAVLSAAALVPLVGVEFLASYRGAKLVKPHIEKEAFKSIKKLHLAGGMSYVAGMAATGAAVYAAVKIKDLITKPQKIKTNEN